MESHNRLFAEGTKKIEMYHLCMSCDAVRSVNTHKGHLCELMLELGENSLDLHEMGSCGEP